MPAQRCKHTQVIAVGGEVEGWTGLAATAHQGQATFLQKAIQKAIDLHPKIPALLDKYVQEHAKTRSAITGLQHDWDEARTVHLRRIAELAIQLKAGLYPGDDDEYEKDRAKVDEACEKTQKEVKAKYEAAVRSLNELAKSTGDSIFGLAESFAPKSRVAGEGNGQLTATTWALSSLEEAEAFWRLKRVGRTPERTPTRRPRFS